jgi:putative transcriptional regulator
MQISGVPTRFCVFSEANRLQLANQANASAPSLVEKCSITLLAVASFHESQSLLYPPLFSILWVREESAMQRQLHSSGSILGIAILLLIAGAGFAVAELGGATGRSTLLLAAPPPRPPFQALPQRSEPLAAGRLLVATPRLAGPIFGRTVVLLLDYDATGAIGVILNRPTSLSLSEIFPSIDDLKARRDRVFLGGPVAPSSMAFLIRAVKRPPESHHLMDDIHMSGSALTLEHVVKTKMPAHRFHAFVGYSGWAPQQLDGEVARGDWWVVPAKPEHIFDVEPDELWQKMMNLYGGVQVKLQRSSMDRGPG